MTINVMILSMLNKSGFGKRDAVQVHYILAELFNPFKFVVALIYQDRMLCKL